MMVLMAYILVLNIEEDNGDILSENQIIRRLDIIILCPK